jgi:hypothetical protein
MLPQQLQHQLRQLRQQKHLPLQVQLHQLWQRSKPPVARC